jgi:hypothetical protein
MLKQASGGLVWSLADTIAIIVVSIVLVTAISVYVYVIYIQVYSLYSLYGTLQSPWSVIGGVPVMLHD